MILPRIAQRAILATLRTPVAVRICGPVRIFGG
jgi:hypothetical protein